MRLALTRNWLGSICKSPTCSRNINKNREKSKWWEEFLVRILKDLLQSLICLLCATVLAVTVDSPVIVSLQAVPVKTASVLVVELDANAQPASLRDAWPHPGTIWFQSSPLLADQASTSHLLTAIWGTKVHLSRSNALKEDILSNQLLTTVLKDLQLNMRLRILTQKSLGCSQLRLFLRTRPWLTPNLAQIDSSKIGKILMLEFDADRLFSS